MELVTREHTTNLSLETISVMDNDFKQFVYSDEINDFNGMSDKIFC